MAAGLVMVVTIGLLAVPVRVAYAVPTPPKAVFIVGPTNGLTQSNLSDAEKMAQQAEAVGMDVRRVFFPHATWDNVLANIQGANLVVYMGHGYGWPSAYTREMTEARQNGMGLNSYDGSGADQYTYYGANRIRESVVLADNAVVILNHLCYAAGNGESGMAIPSEDIARQRVDNMANGWLAAGARAVFAYSWNQKLDHALALMTTDKSMDEIFMTRSNGSPSGFAGWRTTTFASDRTPGAFNRLDPHSKYGFMRALSGDLTMTAADWRSGAPGGETSPPPQSEGPPQITELTADGAGASASQVDPPSFHPNGDGLDEELSLRHTVTRAANLDATVTNADGAIVRTYSVWSASGAGGSRWNGKNQSGGFVPDGIYTLTYVARDASGAAGDPVSTQALVLTAAALPAASKAAFFAADADALAKYVSFKVKVNQPARLTWQIVDSSGQTVRTVRDDSSVSAGRITFKWDGRTDGGAHVADGWYRSLVTATTAQGSYVQERSVYVGAFRVTPSVASPARGDKLTLTIVSSEPLSGALNVEFTQPGIEPWSATATKVTGKTYKVSVTLPSGGEAGVLTMAVMATDREGGRNSGASSLPLR